MAARTKRGRDSKRLAVIRSYQPIRIECELLAQAFDLVQRGLSEGRAGVRDQRAVVDQATDSTVKNSTPHSLLNPSALQHAQALEEVA